MLLLFKSSQVKINQDYSENNCKKQTLPTVENLTFIHVELVTAPSARYAYFAVRLVSAASAAVGNVQNEFCNKNSPRGPQRITHTFTFTHRYTHVQIGAGTIQLGIRYCTVYYGTSVKCWYRYSSAYKIHNVTH